MTKKIMLLGSTGSIGKQVLEIVDKDKGFEVTLLAARTNISLLKKQIYKYSPSFAFVQDKAAADSLKSCLTDSKCRIFSDENELLKILRESEYYMAINAIVGMRGILPTLAIIESGHDIGIANKETLVCAGHILMPLAKEKHSNIYAIDSEHSAIAQSLVGENTKNIDYLIITASGGPFFGKTRAELLNVDVAAALNHPNWSMGRKISIDSATMVNKALEVMEARWLFDVDFDRIKVVIHRQSIVHSAICYVDGAIKAQMGTPSMILPISYALYKYERMSAINRLDLINIARLDFADVSKDIYDGFFLGLEAAKMGGSMPTVFNAANEVAVAEFLAHKIGFLDIPIYIKEEMNKHSLISNPSIDDILEIENKMFNSKGEF